MSQTELNPLTLDEIKGLTEDGNAAAEQVESLLITLQSHDTELCAWVSDALQAIEQVPESHCHALGQYCMHENAPIASWACKLVAQCGPIATELQQVVVDALVTHPQLGVRQQAALALARIPDLTNSTLTSLESAAASDDPRLSRLATQAIEKSSHDRNAA